MKLSGGLPDYTNIALTTSPGSSDAVLLREHQLWQCISALHQIRSRKPCPLLPPQVMHSDLKTKNVLLSNTMNAKISDVGLAQLVDAHSENAPVLAL